MSYYHSVALWLNDIRDTVEYYEPCAVFTVENYRENVAHSLSEMEEVYENIWECTGSNSVRLDDDYDDSVVDESVIADNDNGIVDDGSVSALRRSVIDDSIDSVVPSVKFGELRCVSVLFDESVDELGVLPLFYERVELGENPDDVMVWKGELRYECEEEDDVLESEEFVNSIKIDDEPPHSYPKPQKFPVLEDAVIVRKKLQPNAVRAKTLNCDLSGFSQGKLNEIKGVTKIVIGDELCAKITRQEKLVFEDNEIHVIGRSGQNKVLKDQVELRPGIQQVDKKNVLLHDVNNVPIHLLFDTSKDAKTFVESERLNSPLSEKSSIKTKLLRLLGKRSSREFLVEKGIYMNESIFGNTIQNIYQMHDHKVPEFLTRSVQLIETPANISQVGIYRTSGNLATIQKIRFEVDKGNLSVLDQYLEDVDVLTGALKLFFRELKEPLIPFGTSEELLLTADKKPECINAIVRKLPKANYETLMCLLRHLLNIVEHKETNKMDIYNLTICWGPSLMFVPDNCLDVMTQSSNNSKVLDILLNYYKDNPKDLHVDVDHVVDTRQRIDQRLFKEPEPLKSHKKSSSCSNINDVVYDVVSKITEMIENNAKIEGVYKKPGSQVKIDKIAKKLAKGKLNEIEKVKADVHDFAGALRKYLEDLSEPLIPKAVLEECSGCDNFNYNVVKMKLRKNIDGSKRRDVLTLLLRHVARVLNEEKSNRLTLNDACAYWRNALIRSSTYDDKFKTKLTEMLLETYGDYRATLTEMPHSMPDVIKDIEAMARFSKYENVTLTPHLKDAAIRAEAKVLEDKTDNNDDDKKK